MLKSRGASERPFGELGTPAPPPARSARSRRALLSSGRTLQAPPAPARSPGQPRGHLGCSSGVGPLRRHPRHARPSRRPTRRCGTLPPPRCAPGRHRPAPALPLPHFTASARPTDARRARLPPCAGSASTSSPAQVAAGLPGAAAQGRFPRPRPGSGRVFTRLGPAPPSRVKANLTAAPSAPARASRRGSLQPAAPSVARGACARGLRVRRSLMHAGPRAGRVVPSRRVQPRPPPVRGLVRGQRAPPRPTRLRTRERAPLSATLIRSSARVAPGRQRGGGAGVLRRLGAAGDRQRLAAAPHQSGPRGRGPLRPSLVRQCVPSDLTKEALPCG